MACSKGTGTVLVMRFPVCTLGFSLSPKIILDIASHSFSDMSLPQAHKQIKTEEWGPYKCVSTPPVRMESWNTASLGMRCWAPLAVVFFPPEVSESSDKEGSHSSLWSSWLYIQFWCRALMGFGAHVAAVILLKQLHWNSLGFSHQNVSHSFL